jgi:hypothetical protein
MSNICEVHFGVLREENKFAKSYYCCGIIAMRKVRVGNICRFAFIV